MCASIYSDEKRIRVRLRGQVQGVGFRPFIYGLAQQLSLTGWVLNDGEGVLIEAQGFNVEAFEHSIRTNPPELARIDHMEVTPLGYLGEDQGFIIKATVQSDNATDIGPDSAVCPDCLEELFDPNNRRYGYPFINCTNCGPRYTITYDLPYDRAQTSMASFDMCPTCHTEYSDPMDRRFHAQPNCCPDCGPELSMSVDEMTQRLHDGQILAVKGLGGFHLVCDALNEETVLRLRKLKNRPSKPFALMVSTAKDALPFAKIDTHEKKLLESKERPVVLLSRYGEILPDACNWSSQTF